MVTDTFMLLPLNAIEYGDIPMQEKPAPVSPSVTILRNSSSSPMACDLDFFTSLYMPVSMLARDSAVMSLNLREPAIPPSPRTRFSFTLKCPRDSRRDTS